MTLQDRDHMGSFSGPSLDARSFQRIAQFAHETAGLSIAQSKSAMVRTRLARRLRALNLPSYDRYCDFVLSEEGIPERTELISALTTNVSHFFRESHHFELLSDQLLPDLMRSDATSRPIRFWSAGCSNGQEPLSLAITLHEAGFIKSTKDTKILATDIDPQVLNFAKKATYPNRMLDGLPEGLKAKYFQPTTQGDNWAAIAGLSNLITFNPLNLLDPWPMKGKFDAIFCRNVVIYFDQATQDQLWQKFIDVLRPGGWLFLGHSERISDQYQPYFETLGSTAYRLIKP